MNILLILFNILYSGLKSFREGKSLLVSNKRLMDSCNMAGNAKNDCWPDKQASNNIESKGNSGFEGRDIREHIRSSWDRCIKLGLSPHHLPRLERVSNSQLELIKKRYEALIKEAKEYISKMKLMLPNENVVMGLANNEGILFYVEGTYPELESMGYQPGYMHSESNMGNNAIGTCIYTEEPTVIIGTEHFLESLSKWASFAAPIYNIDNKLEAVFTIIMPEKLANKDIFGMVVMAAHGLEKEFRILQENTELLHSNEMLAEFDEEIIQTASMISHEVKNSLSNISAYIQLLQLEKILDDKRAGKILTEISRINKILDEFKRLTKPIHMNFSRHSLNEILRSTIEIMKPKANIRGIKFSFSVPEEQIWIRADKNALQQVFINIIENAIQAMEGRGEGSIKVGLEYDEENERILIKFTDTGSGIPEEKIDQIFNLFYTTKETGNGLGLSLCQSIVKYHGGEIKVDSVVGQGSTFTIVLPARMGK